MSAELVYVSWGGSGRAATFRAALERAAAQERDLVYLAILDDATFSDLDDATLALAKDELAWLLDTQIELTRSQVGDDGQAVRVLVRAGDVADEISEVMDALDGAEVLIGAPVPLTGHASVSELIDELAARVDQEITLLDE